MLVTFLLTGPRGGVRAGGEISRGGEAGAAPWLRALANIQLSKNLPGGVERIPGARPPRGNGVHAFKV